MLTKVNIGLCISLEILTNETYNTYQCNHIELLKCTYKDMRIYISCILQKIIQPFFSVLQICFILKNQSIREKLRRERKYLSRCCTQEFSSDYEPFKDYQFQVQRNHNRPFFKEMTSWTALLMHIGMMTTFQTKYIYKANMFVFLL